MRSGPPIPLLVSLLALSFTAVATAQDRLLPLGDSITAGALGGPNCETYDRGGYRYFLERFLEGSNGGSSGFSFTGSVDEPNGSLKGTVASYAGQWFSNPKPLDHPLHSGYPGYGLAQLDGLVFDGTVPVGASDVILLQVGTNNIDYSSTTPATAAEIASWTTDYRDLLDHILEKNPSVKVIMAKIPPVTTGAVSGDIGANAARIVPFNEQVVEPLFHSYRAAHPGQFFLVDNYSPIDPLNTTDSFSTATNDHDYYTGDGDGVHPYNAGHRKIAVNFWNAYQLAKGKAAADIVTVHDSPRAADACILGNGSNRDGIDVTTQPYVRASAHLHKRAKYYIKLDLAGKPKNWDDVRFNLVFWGAPSAPVGFANCCNDAPATTTLELYGIADGQDAWTESSISWTNAPGNHTTGNSVTGTYLGDLVIPAGAQTGDIISVSSDALRDFVNLHRGMDGLLTFAIVGTDLDPGFLPSFQDSDLRDYLSAFLQLTLDSASLPPNRKIPPPRFQFDFDAQPNPQVTITFQSSDTRSYLVSASTDLENYDLVLESGIPGAVGQSETTVTVDLPPDYPDRLFLRVEQE